MALDYILLTDTFGHWVITTNEIIDAINDQISVEALSNLLTNDKSSLVAAINELYNNKYDKTGGLISGNVSVTGNTAVNGSMSVGSNGGGNSTISFFDDTADVFRELMFDSSAQIWKVRDKSGILQNLFHSGSNINLGTFSSLVGDTQLQFKGGSTAENDAYIGAVKEITIDIEVGSLRLHDGVTPGGIVISGGGIGDEYIANVGTEFVVGGTTITMPLSVDMPDDKTGIELYFAGLRQDQSDILSLSGQVITLTSPIPLGINKIVVKI